MDLFEGLISKVLLNIALYPIIPIDREILEEIVHFLFFLFEVVEDSFLSFFLHWVLLSVLKFLWSLGECCRFFVFELFWIIGLFWVCFVVVTFIVVLLVFVIVKDIIFKSLSEVFEFADHDFEFLSFIHSDKRDFFIAHVNQFLKC